MTRFSGGLDFGREVPFSGSPAGTNGSLCILADLRLDNRRELGERLDLPGDDDAALLAAAYRRWGADCTDSLEGDFAFAIWDGQEQLLLCACDPLGIKPLHYTVRGPFRFASEIRRLLQNPAVSRCPDPQTLADYLLDNTEPPGRTFFRDVRRLLPGHRLLVRRQGLRLERYFQFKASPLRYRDRREYAAACLDHLRHAVENRLPAGEPAVGIALSGGLDSSSVAALAHQHAVRTGGPALRASSFVFDELASCDERPWIGMLSRELGFPVSYVEAEKLWFLGDTAAYTPALESPFMAWDGGLLQMLLGLRQRGARVLLTGHGGDDLFGGSHLVYWDRLRRGDLGAAFEVARYGRKRNLGLLRLFYLCFLQPALPPRRDRLLRRLLRRADLAAPPSWISPAFLRRVEAERLPEPEPPPSFRRGASRDIQEAISHVGGSSLALHWYDRHAAALGMEVRHPFLDRRLADFLLSVPPRELFELGSSKPLLREAMKGLLPEPIRRRQDKTKLGPFIDFALAGKERRQVESLTWNSLAVELGILDGKTFRAESMLYFDISKKDTRRSLWYAFTIEIWLRKHRQELDFSNWIS